MSTASPADDPTAPVSGGDLAPGAPADAARVGEPVSGGQPVSLAPLSGRIVGGKWRVLGLLGRGGMGTVYEAQNTAIGKRVALKFIEGQADHEAIARFQREAEAASAVDSAHIVQVFDTVSPRREAVKKSITRVHSSPSEGVTGRPAPI